MTTPGNAMDAGPGLRDALLARLAELRGLAGVSGAHSPGPWTVGMSPFYIYDANGKEVTEDQFIFGPTKHFIAAHSPDLMGAVWEGLAGEVQRHRVLTDGVMAGQCAQCPDGGHVEDGVCLFLRRWCRVLGVGTEPTCTCPADHCLCGACAFCTSRPASECCPAMPCDWNRPEKCPVHGPAVAASPHAEGEPEPERCAYMLFGTTRCRWPEAVHNAGPGTMKHAYVPPASPETPVPGSPIANTPVDGGRTAADAQAEHDGRPLTPPPVPGEGVAGCGFPVDTEDDAVTPCRRPAGHPLFVDDGIGCSAAPPPAPSGSTEGPQR